MYTQAMFSELSPPLEGGLPDFVPDTVCVLS
jgi:hypothetical protein